MNGTDIGKIITDACDATRKYTTIRHEGNLGMAIIGCAIAEHAQAVRELADSVDRAAGLIALALEKYPTTQTTTGGPTDEPNDLPA